MKRLPLFISLMLLSYLLSGCQTTQPSEKILEVISASKMYHPRGEVVAQDFIFDAKTGEIRYNLPESALVRLRVGIREGGPMLRTLLDWQEQGKGSQVVVWNKKDDSGKVDFSSRLDDLMVVLSAVSTDLKERAHYEGGARGFHTSPTLQISFPHTPEETLSNATVARDVFPLRVSVDEKDKAWLSEAKFEVSLFIDTIFLMEDEEGVTPFNYQLDTKNLTNGLHTITANLVGYTGEIGTASVKIYVDN